MNLLTPLSSSLTWSHAPERWEPLPSGGIRVTVPGKTDYFQDPSGVVRKDDAPYLWLPVQGDFVAQAHLQPSHLTTWDAAAVMARQDETHWAKICYESTDIGTRAAVSVVTNGISDDANGVDLTVPDLWLQIVRVGDVFGLHYALDGKSWRMVRVFRLPVAPQIQVGLVGQSPAGPGTTVDFLSFSVEGRTVKDLRAGK